MFFWIPASAGMTIIVKGFMTHYASKSEEQIKLLQLDKSGIRVAAYLTELPTRKLLQRKLHEAILLARLRL